jgi:chromosome segregation ATPase
MEQQTQTLKELQASIKAIDAKRSSNEITDSEREMLELTAVALRDAECVAIASIQKQVIKNMQEQTAALNEQAKAIRTKVTKINKMSKALNSIESVVKTAVKIVAAIAKW